MQINNSYRVRFADFVETDFVKNYCSVSGEPFKHHRKLWEFAAIYQVFLERVLDNNPAPRVLGFGVGKEQLPELFAGEGAFVEATDAPLTDTIKRDWLETGQHAGEPGDFVSCLGGGFMRRSAVDMNNIPSHLANSSFDMTWSCGSLEHIGGLDYSIQFLLRQMDCLKPGGVAVHTTELDVHSVGWKQNIKSLDSPNLCLFTKHNLESLCQRMRDLGHLMLPLDLTTGPDPYSADIEIDKPPYNSQCHLNVSIVDGKYVTTSVLLVIIKDGVLGESTKQSLDSAEEGSISSGPAIPSGRPRLHTSLLSERLRVLWVGDAVVPTGFARCTHEVCDYLYSRGVEVSVLGINYFGDPHRYPYPIYPCVHPLEGGNDLFGVGRLPQLIYDRKPHVVVFLNDPWNIPTYTNVINRMKFGELGIQRPKLLGWLAVDGNNQVRQHIKDLDHAIVWTDFAVGALSSEHGLTREKFSVVPLGVDLNLFKPLDQTESRRRVFPEEVVDGFILGYVGRNQLRKRVDLALEVFTDFSREIDNTYLYLHSAPTGDTGYDIDSLIRYYGLQGKVMQPNITVNHGVDDSVLPSIYSALDVFITTTMGEGFGLPILEALACGCPCVVPDWSGLSSWLRSSHPTGAIRIGCTEEVTPSLGANAWVMGGRVDKDMMVETLDLLYRDSHLRQAMKVDAAAFAMGFSWSVVGPRFYAVLHSMATGAAGQEPDSVPQAPL